MFCKAVELFVGDHAQALDISTEHFIESILIDFMAKRQAEYLGCGKLYNPPWWPFSIIGDKMLRGEELFNFLVRHHIDELGGLPGELDDTDDPGEQAKLVDREKQRRADMRGRDKLRMLIVDRGLISAETARRLTPGFMVNIEMLRDGKLDEETFKERLQSYCKMKGIE